MRFTSRFNAVALLLLLSVPANAQWFEPVFRTQVDPTTGRRDSVQDAWATGRAEQEARDQAWDQRQQRDTADREQRQADDTRYQQQRDQLRELSDQAYQANVNTLNQRHRAGLAVINSGRATTAFIPQPGFSIVAHLTRRFPAAKSLIDTIAVSANERFHQEIRSRGLSERDLADGEALAFVIAFQAYSGQRPGTVHLAFARNLQRTALLRSSIAQGADNAERQRDFETFGTLAFAALALTERNDPMGKEIAGSVITGLTRLAPYSLAMTSAGFAHRGEQIIASGRATTMFTPSANSVTPGYYARRFSGQYVARSTFENQARDAITAFYGEVRTRGGNSNDLASLVAFLLAANATAITGQEPNAAQISSAYDIARNAILRSRDIQAAPDSEKQLAVELMMITSVAAIRDRDGMRGRNNIQQIFQVLGEDPRNYDLTPTGLRRKS